MLTVATWNVLAQAYVLPERYAGAAPGDLDASTRTARVHQRIADLLDRVDVLALQEVEPALLEWLDVERVAVVPALRPNGRDGVALASTRRTLGDPEARTTVDHRRTWASASVDGVRIITVHLDPEWSAKHLHGARQAHEIAEAAADHADAVLLGDLNSTWERANGRALASHGFTAAHTGATAATNGKARVLDAIAVRGHLVATAEPTALPDAGTAYWLPTADEPSDHVPLVARITRRAYPM